MKRDIYADVTARIVAELEAGAAPWIKPWSASPGANTPCNAATNRPTASFNPFIAYSIEHHERCHLASRSEITGSAVSHVRLVRSVTCVDVKT